MEFTSSLSMPSLHISSRRSRNGAGAWPTVPAACADLVRKVDEIPPQSEAVATYGRLYPIFRGLYPTLQSTFAALADFEG